MTPPRRVHLYASRSTSTWFTLFATIGIGCSASGTNVSGSGGSTASGSGGGTNPGTGGRSTSGSGGSSPTGSGGSVTSATGGSGNTATGGSGTSASGGTGNLATGGSGNTSTGGVGAPAGSGGSTGRGGGTAGSGVGGTSAVNPPGYWTYAPRSWAGCSWTGVDMVANTTTMNTPWDFLTKPAADPYCVSGTVHANDDSVALLGFNLAEPAAGANCAYDPKLVKTLAGVTLTGTGIAVSFSKKISTDMRIQVQGPNGRDDPNDRWCAKITDPVGPVFVPYTAFSTSCWNLIGTPFNPAANKIAAISFLVAGGTAPTPFNYCIGGFSTGTSVADAPPYTGMSGPVTGTIGGPGDRSIDFQRVKVAAGGKSYVVQNNNWGSPDTTNQTIQYTDNSFKITSPTGASPDGMKPASFPSIFIGASGDTQMGTYSTHLNNAMANQPGDNLPKQISAIQSIRSTFRYTPAGGDYNATYDIWFAAGLPTSTYDDGLSGFVMIWLYKPGNRSPISSTGTTPARSGVTIPGAPGTWNVFVGPRGIAPNPNRPVVSYIATSTLPGLTNVDIKAFITDAAMHGINSSWYLTDVFAGFEIWNGSGTTNLQLQEFTAVVQ